MVINDLELSPSPPLIANPVNEVATGWMRREVIEGVLLFVLPGRTVEKGGARRPATFGGLRRRVLVTIMNVWRVVGKVSQ